MRMAMGCVPGDIQDVREIHCAGCYSRVAGRRRMENTASRREAGKRKRGGDEEIGVRWLPRWDVFDERVGVGKLPKTG